MKPSWDKLMKLYADSKTALVGDVDCTAAGKPLCEEHGVQGFPTIKWGDPAALEDYEGGRELKDLKKFAEESLKPICSPANIDLCDDAKKEQIQTIQSMSAEDLATAIKKSEADMKLATETFDKGVEQLQKTYEELEKTKTATLKEIKDSGLGLMKAVQASAKQQKTEL
eukprot:TRINITY_DN3603_c0_g1_i15.p1 TRINITY_DN3603_c0_g1~~TRINITY_DN3603_c0_g1_i15.p1  ORF type:complete len:169 (+),score=60.97 TRINITY_DN3603_c0_g1_i15:219-725(+)